MTTHAVEHTAIVQQDQLRTIEEFAEQIRATPSTIRYKLQVDPNFPRGFKLGVRRLWKQSSIDNWINEQYEAEQEKRRSA